MRIGLNSVFLTIVSLFMTLSVATQAAEKFEEGKHYEVLSKPIPVTLEDGKDVAVWEIFGYGCPHCFNLEPALERWKTTLNEGVQYQPVPALFGRHWDVHGQAYVTAELMGVSDVTHAEFFNAIHIRKKRLNSIEAFADVAAEFGIDKDKFLKMSKSFAVNVKMNQAKTWVRSAGITSTPSMVVNGKYRITGQTAGSNVRMLEVVNFLIEKEQAAK